MTTNEKKKKKEGGRGGGGKRKRKEKDPIKFVLSFRLRGIEGEPIFMFKFQVIIKIMVSLCSFISYLVINNNSESLNIM